MGIFTSIGMDDLKIFTSMGMPLQKFLRPLVCLFSVKYIKTNLDIMYPDKNYPVRISFTSKVI